MKKTAVLVLVLAIAISMFAGCAPQAPAASSPAASAPASEAAAPSSAAPAPSESAAPATSAAASQAATGVMPAVPKDKIKVGVIHIGDPSAGSGYTYAHDQGIVDMQKNLGLADNQIDRKINVSDTDPAAIDSAMRECVEEGCQIIFATSWGYMDTCEALAKEFPEVIFSHASGYKSNTTNFNNYFGRIYQARYLSGIAAGLKTKSGKIGYVAAMGKDNSEVTGGIDAFAIGVQEANAKAKVYVKVTNSWYDPAGETNAAKALISEGCDVIAQHCDTPNPQLEAQKAKVWGVGYNSDMIKDAPDGTITSTIWHWGVYYTAAVKAVIEGTWDDKNYFGGMKEGMVGITELNDKVAAEGTAAAIEKATAKIMDGSYNVFDGVLKTNDGKTVGEEGKTLDDATIAGKINWYYENVVAQ
jgi:basic membrane protein A